jgi:hypothetical protein
MPPLFKELKRRAAKILHAKFGSIGGVEQRVDIEIDDDDDTTMKSID